MSKIKSIQISDFRIYSGQHEFSFDNEGVLSNLMVIYAPNGFGKTSFFDAIEWCYNSKIRRFETEVLLQEINRRDYSSGDKILLTNRKSFKNGKSGNVAIYTSDDKIIKRTAVERKATKLDYKYDYRTISPLTSDYSQQVLDRLVKTNILTQDKIDEFLRHTKPDERFSQLQNFWPEGETAVSILEKIDSYLNMLSLEKLSIESKILEAKQGIKEYLNEDEQIVPINNAIEELIKRSVTGFKIEPLTDNVNAQTYKTILETIQTFIERIRLLIKNTEGEVSELDTLEQSFQVYIEALSSKNTIEDDLSKLTLLAKLYEDLKAYNILQSTIESSKGTIINTQTKLNRLVELTDTVSEIYLNIDKQQGVAEECRKNIDIFLQNINNYRVSAHNLQSTLNDWEKEEKSLSKRLIAWDNELADYKFWTAEHVKESRKLIKSQKSVEEKGAAINVKKTRRLLLQTILNNHNYDYLPEEDALILKEQLSTLNDQIGFVDKINYVVNELQNQINQAISLDETFDKVLAWGEQYIRDCDIKHCPLCATEFNDVTTLLAKIELQKSGNSKTSILKEQLDQAMIQKQISRDQLLVLNQRIDDYIQSILNHCNDDIGNLQMECDISSSEISSIEKNIESATRSAEKSFLNLKLDVIASGIEGQLNFDKIKMENEARLIEIKSKSIRLANLIAAKNELASNAENKVFTFRNKVSATDNIIEMLRVDNRLIEAERLMKELDLPNHNFFMLTLVNKLDELTIRLNDLQEQLFVNLNHIEDIRQQIKMLPLQVAELELPGIRLTMQEQLTQKLHIIKNYLGLFRAVSDIIEPTKEFLAETLIGHKENLDRINMELSSLENIFVRLQVIEKNVLKNALEEQLIQLNSQIGPIETGLTKTWAARKAAETYINQEINKYFNQDVINQIYSRIEPHPDLNQIKINPRVTDKGPILDIKAISNNEALDPSLYLSAGQLNVLSLSIFLAKAFETRSGEIDTIFMDDPIQNLSDINILSFIDLIRTMITKYDRQIVISSHDENFYKLMRNKMPSDAFNVRYYEIESFGIPKHVQ